MKHQTPNNDSLRTDASRSGMRGGPFAPKLNPWLLCVVAILALGGFSARAQASREYQIKAAFLFNFAQFTDWPTNAFPEEKAPFIIGIVGADPFGGALEETVRGETVQGHPLVIQRYARVADIKTCHILFISQSEVRRTGDILKSLQGKPVLTITDADNAASSGAIIRFVVENNKVHFCINAEAAHEAKLTLSSKLLRVADAAPNGGRAP